MMVSRRQDVDTVFGALADPTRRELFEAIFRAPGVTTSDLCEATTGMTRWGVMKHLSVLRDAQLIQTMATGRLRRHYAERSSLAALTDWLAGL